MEFFSTSLQEKIDQLRIEEADAAGQKSEPNPVIDDEKIE